MTKLWGGRFSKKTNKLVEQFTKSIHYDCRLAQYDCIGSLVHINVLKKAGLLTAQEHKKLQTGLKSILKKAERGMLKIDSSFEDIHSYIQDLLEKDKKVGQAALKLQTCRSRNDQIVFDVKLYCIDQLTATQKLASLLTLSIKKLAKKYAKLCIPGYTHLQHAIPVSAKDYLMSYADMLERDKKKLAACSDAIELTLGSGALAGTPIQSASYRVKISKGVIVNAPTNSIDTVSSRDFVIEALSVLSIVGMHLSRLAEDLILWSTKEFDFVDIDDAFCTGSSLMPQKKNPDVLELIRGYSGKLYGNLISVLVMMKGLPLAYNRDMQLDKEPLFESFDIIQSELAVLAELLKNIKFKKGNIAKQLDDESLYATDLADYLVKNKVAFKEAHTIIGKLIQHKIKSGQEIRQMSAGVLKGFHPLLTTKIVKKIIDPRNSVNSKKSVRKRKI